MNTTDEYKRRKWFAERFVLLCFVVANCRKTKSAREDQIMPVQWNKDADAALAEAKATRKPLLIDFSAAPA